MQISDYFHLVDMEAVLPQESRAIYTRELQRQGDSPELAEFRLDQRIRGLREQHATQLFAAAQREYVQQA